MHSVRQRAYRRFPGDQLQASAFAVAFASAFIAPFPAANERVATSAFAKSFYVF
jgi:hypothetical protein